MSILNLLTTKKLLIPASLFALLCFAGGAAVLGGFNKVMDYTNTLEFCIGCHEMADNVYPEYQKSVHYSNAAGVRAVCSDCHVPKQWFPKVERKVRASLELIAKVTGKIDTKEKFEAHRLEMAKRVWAEMEANDSRECRNCHDFGAMDFSKQHAKASKDMQKAMAEGDTCISCHKGIAHKLPDMSQGYKTMFEDLKILSVAEGAKADHLYTLMSKPYFKDLDTAKSEGRSAGSLLGGTDVTVLDRKGDFLKVRLSGWQQDEVDRVIYALRGQRIFSATVGKKNVEQIQRLATEVDPNTDLTWHKVQLDVWVSKADLISDGDKLWAYTSEMYSAVCSTCHGLRAPDHFLANQWIGSLKAMKRFIGINKEQYRLLQKYLQLNAKDTGGSGNHG